MTDLIDPDLIRQHVRCERDDQDEYLAALADAAVSAFEDYTGRSLVAPDTPAQALSGDQVPLTPSIRHGLLLLIGHWYENREMSSERPLSEIPAATTALWSPYRWFHLGDVHEN